MSRVIRVLGVMLLVALTERPALAEDPAPSPPRYRVAAIRHRFFLTEPGVLESEQDSQGRTWNVPFVADTVLVLVDVVGPQFPVNKAASVDFKATAGKTLLAHRWISLQQDYGSSEGHITVPFLVYGVGCEPIKIAVNLQAGRARSAVTQVIPLACGE